jgi:hypothetical protein
MIDEKHCCIAFASGDGENTGQYSNSGVTPGLNMPVAQKEVQLLPQAASLPNCLHVSSSRTTVGYTMVSGKNIVSSALSRG